VDPPYFCRRDCMSSADLGTLGGAGVEGWLKL
jgi:hypothetical protein